MQPNGQERGPVFREGGAFVLPRCGGWLLFPLLFLFLLGMVTPLQGQVDPWNGARVLDLIREARTVRQDQVQDSTLQSYSSNARGFVYFYLDREDTGERILVKTDQIALEVFWKAPDQFKQRIVGLRDEESLPTNINYHLDHLVVVQDEFGDRIRIGDGDEVEAVMHPVAPGSDSFYDFLLADSVTVQLPSSQETIRVYEIQVRPKDFDVPGFVGNVFLDRDTKAIVRMSFTFTPSSYVDDYLDHISISLENSLWLGQHWLPYRQQLEIRREVPFLDFPAGSVIRGSFEVRDYEINPLLHPNLFLGQTITALPEAARESFPFEEDIHAQLDEEGLQGFAPPPEMGEIQSLALTLAKDRYLSGLGRSRLFLPSPTVSSALRYNRAEGVFLGAGVSHTPHANLGLALYGGFSIGREKPTLEGRISGGQLHPTSGIELFHNRPRDLGPVPAISGVLNSLAAVFLQDDYTDLFFSTGAQATHRISLSSGHVFDLTARWEEHRSASDVVSTDLEDTNLRPVIPVDEGAWASLGVAASVKTPWPNINLSAGGLVGRFEDMDFGSISGDLSYRRRWMEEGTDLSIQLQGGGLFGDPPTQAHYFLGGRQTIPGYSFRARMGDRYWLLRAEASTDLIHPFIRLRAFGSAGDTRLPEPDCGGDEACLLPGMEEPGVLASAGLGLGLGWDILRLDLARGLREGGEWELILWVKHDFWPWL